MTRQPAASHSLLLGACLSLAISACDRKSVIEEMRETKNKVCQCTDKGCVAALRASSKTLEKRLEGLSASEQAKAQAIALEMMTCMQKF